MNAPKSLPLTLKLRVPVFASGTAASVKIGQLEDYLLLSAYSIGEMHEERVDFETALRDLDEQWDEIEGYQALMASKTVAGADAARAKLRPDLAASRRELRHWVKQLDREIERLDNEASKVSRAYTMITGS